MASGVMEELGGTDERIARLFRLATRRPPTPDEVSRLRDYYERELDRFRREPENAEILVETGVMPVNPDQNISEMAAFTNVAAVVMNTPDSYSIR